MVLSVWSPPHSGRDRQARSAPRAGTRFEALRGAGEHLNPLPTRAGASDLRLRAPAIKSGAGWWRRAGNRKESSLKQVLGFHGDNDGIIPLQTIN